MQNLIHLFTLLCLKFLSYEGNMTRSMIMQKLQFVLLVILAIADKLN